MVLGGDDSAFEPHSSYLFEEYGDDENFRSMQRNVAALDNLDGTDCPYDFPMMVRPHDYTSMNDHFNPDCIDPYMFDPSEASADHSSWHASHAPVNPQSVQTNILNSRSSVSHQFGQITPPNDDTSQSEKSSVFASAEQQALNAKSERARNAANQRHAKAKKARRDSARNGASLDDEMDQADDNREKYREKNRLAAAKCRAKKKVHTGDLEQSARDITKRNNLLKAEARELRDLFSSLRNQALAHDPTQGCDCQAIHCYNMHKVHEAVRGVARGSSGHAVPSTPSVDSEDLSPIEVPSRTQSSSGARPLLPTPAMPLQSPASSLGFSPAAGDFDQASHAFESESQEG